MGKIDFHDQFTMFKIIKVSQMKTGFEKTRNISHWNIVKKVDALQNSRAFTTSEITPQIMIKINKKSLSFSHNILDFWDHCVATFKDFKNHSFASLS